MIRKTLTWLRWGDRLRHLAEDPSPRGYAVLGRALAAAGDANGSATVAAEGFARFPEAVGLRALYASARALALRAALRRSSNKARSGLYAQLVALHLVMGETRLAAETASEWVESHPKEGRAKAALGRVRLAQFRATGESRLGFEAVRLLEDASRLPDAGAGTFRDLAELAAEVGSWRLARAHFARWRALADDDPAIAVFEAQLGFAEEFEEEESDLTAAIRRRALQGAAPETEGPRTETPAGAGPDRAASLLEEPGVEQVARLRLGASPPRGRRGGNGFSRVAQALAGSAARTTVRLGLGEPVDLVAGGEDLAFAAAFGPGAAAVAKCRSLEAAERILGGLEGLARTGPGKVAG